MPGQERDEIIRGAEPFMVRLFVDIARTGTQRRFRCGVANGVVGGVAVR